MTASEVYAVVVERCDYRCQCRSPCPSHHRQTAAGWCWENGQTPGNPLMVAPSAPGPDPLRRAAADPADLVAWCARCWQRAVTAARKHAAGLAPPDGGQTDLFDTREVP